MKKLEVSGLGIASFSIAVIGFIGMIFNFYYAATLPETLPDEAIEFVIVGLAMMIIVFASIIGLGLGIAAVCDKNKTKSLSIIGICTNSANILLNGSIIFLGAFTEV